jgi:LysR family hydrogen peroxide-inducible transcriptional activator
MVVHRDFMKKRLKQALKEEIIAAVPEKLKKKKSQTIVPV